MQISLFVHIALDFVPDSERGATSQPQNARRSPFNVTLIFHCVFRQVVWLVQFQFNSTFFWLLDIITIHLGLISWQQLLANVSAQGTYGFRDEDRSDKHLRPYLESGEISFTYSALLLEVWESMLELAEPWKDPLDTINLGGNRKTWLGWRILLFGETMFNKVSWLEVVVSQLLELLPGRPLVSQSYCKKKIILTIKVF